MGGCSTSRMHGFQRLLPTIWSEGQPQAGGVRRGVAWQSRWRWLECVGRVGVSLAQAFMWLQEVEVTDPVRLECGSVACLGPT